MRTDPPRASEDELEVWRLLPWLANDSLSEEELEAVLRHLQTSPAAREELMFLSELRHAAEVASAQEYEPSTERLERLMERIEAHESDTATVVSTDGAEEAADRAAAAVASDPRRDPLRWISWGLTAAAALLFASLLWRGPVGDADPLQPRSAAPFRTLSEEATVAGPSTPAGIRIRIVFADGTKEIAMRNLLLEHRLQIVAGPTANGVYTMGAAPSAEPVAGSHDLLQRLRSDSRVVFAELATDE